MDLPFRAVAYTDNLTSADRNYIMDAEENIVLTPKFAGCWQHGDET